MTLISIEKINKEVLKKTLEKILFKNYQELNTIKYILFETQEYFNKKTKINITNKYINHIMKILEEKYNTIIYGDVRKIDNTRKCIRFYNNNLNVNYLKYVLNNEVDELFLDLKNYIKILQEKENSINTFLINIDNYTDKYNEIIDLLTSLKEIIPKHYEINKQLPLLNNRFEVY